MLQQWETLERYVAADLPGKFPSFTQFCACAHYPEQWIYLVSLLPPSVPKVPHCDKTVKTCYQSLKILCVVMEVETPWYYKVYFRVLVGITLGFIMEVRVNFYSILCSLLHCRAMGSLFKKFSQFLSENPFSIMVIHVEYAKHWFTMGQWTSANT